MVSAGAGLGFVLGCLLGLVLGVVTGLVLLFVLRFALGVGLGLVLGLVVGLLLMLSWCAGRGMARVSAYDKIEVMTRVEAGLRATARATGRVLWNPDPEPIPNRLRAAS